MRGVLIKSGLCLLWAILLFAGPASAQSDPDAGTTGQEEIDPQEKVVIDSILISGYRKTKEKVILWQMSVQEGDTIRLADLETVLKKNEDNIYNMGLFTVVTVRAVMGEGTVTLQVQVQERWFVWPTPYVALEERTFNEWWEDKDLDRLVYGMGVEWYNLTGWNDKMYVYAQNGYSRRVTFQYNRPWVIPRAKIDGRLTFAYVNNKEIGYGTEGGYLKLARLGQERMRKSYTGSLTLSRRLSPREQIQFSMGYQHFSLSDSITYFNPRYLTNGAGPEHYPTVGLAYVRDERDIRSFPLAGYKYGISVRQLGFFGLGTTHFTKIALTASHHIPLSRRWNFAYGAQQFLLLGDRVPYYDKYFIGFGSFLRGYERYVIDGSSVSLLKAEWKFGVIPRQFFHLKWIPSRRFQDFPLGLYISAYADAGYVSDNTWNNLDPTLKNRALLGYGVGLNLNSIYDSLLRVEYSRNHFGQGGLYLSAIVSIQ